MSRTFQLCSGQLDRHIASKGGRLKRRTAGDLKWNGPEIESSFRFKIKTHTQIGQMAGSFVARRQRVIEFGAAFDVGSLSKTEMASPGGDEIRRPGERPPGGPNLSTSECAECGLGGNGGLF
jgi:hypothetical protein